MESQKSELTIENSEGCGEIFTLPKMAWRAEREGFTKRFQRGKEGSGIAALAVDIWSIIEVDQEALGVNLRL